MQVQKQLLALSLSLASILTLAGCATTSGSAITASPTESATETVEPTPEPVFITAPLTGVQYLEGTNPNLELPAISAKIDNTHAGRPQLALNDADVVFVTRVEGGMTRLLPIWHSRVPEVIGPVRSVRPVDPTIVDAYDGVFVYSGGQAPFKNAARDTGLVMSDEDTEMNNDTYYREKTRVAPWNLYFKAALLQQTHTEQPAPQATFEFDAVPTAVAIGTQVNGLTVKYPQLTSDWAIGEASFPWAASSEPAWLRTMDGTPHLQDNGDQVVAKNVIVMEVEHDNSFIDHKYGAIPKAKIVNNTGVAHIFSEGFYIKATWSKGETNEPIVLKLEDGSSVKLAPGNTWIEMMDTAKSKLTMVTPEVATEE